MATEPRKELAEIPDDQISESISPLSWTTIKQRCDLMDHCAVGNVSPDATLILSLVLKLTKRT